MDTRYIVNHIKNEEQAVHDDDEHCTSPRYINSTYHQSESSYTALNQKCLKRHYDQMMSSSPFCGSNDGTCFLRPLAQHPHHYHPLHHHHHQPILFRHQPSYNAIPPPLPFDPSSVCPGDIPSHLLLVQEPKFPPQTFDIPDIYDSNSVFGGGDRGPLEPPGAFGDYSSDAQPPSYAGNLFYASPNLSDRHSPRGGGSVAAVPPPSPQPTTAFPAGAAPWQQQQQPLTPSRVLSSTGSTDSSPGSHAEESTTAETASSLQQPQQVQPSAKSNGLTSSHSSISRLPNKKARSPKRRKRKDPNEPQKPVSAYSLFFRNAQAAIKSQNPSATFGDVSKIVASMWDGLDDDVKNFYKRQMEMAKKEYLKQLAIYRATLISKDVQEKTGADTEAGISTAQHQAPPPPPPPPTTPPIQTPSSQKADDGTGSSLSPLCVPSMGFQTQQPLSPTTEPVGHHHHLHHHHHLLHHMMSPSSASHTQPSPLFYQDGSPCLQIGYTSSSDASSSSSAAMRSNFLTYGQKLDHESVMQRIPEPSPYFIGMGLDAEYNKSGEFISLGNGFVNGLCREIPCRSFVESDEADDQKLT